MNRKLVAAFVILGALIAPSLARADVVTEWNRTMISALEATNLGPQPSSRVAAIVQGSVFDAVNGIERRYTPVHVDAAAPRGASRGAAAANAAYTALVALLPTQKARFDQELQTTLAEISDDPSDPGQSVERGLAWGQTVANAILAWRASDGFTAVLPPYVPGIGPGAWQPTPPAFAPPIGRNFANMTPWAMTSPSQFLPGGPPSPTSARFAQDLAEVKAYGSVSSAVRTADETQAAVFWQVDTPTALWNRVADDLADANATTLSENSRLLALMNVALADAMIATFNAKNTYNAWRPITAIRALEDPGWTPLLPTPPHQEYPSAHSTVSSAPGVVLASFYGDDTPLAFTSAGMPGVTRSFASFSSAVQEIASSRIWIGFHFRYSCDAGIALGSSVGNYVLANVALRVHGQ
jgi:PAP2 superfamily protein